MAMALDMDELVAAASNGTGKANGSMVASDSIYFSETQKKRLPYDLAAAKKELQASGYKGEQINIIANKRGNVPSFPAAVIAQAMLQQIGLNVQIEVLDYATQVDRRRSGNYQIISQSVAPRLDPALMYSFYVGDKDKNASLMWDNPKAIELMKAAYAEIDQKKRQVIFDHFHELMLQEMPASFLYDMIDVWGATSPCKASLSGSPMHGSGKCPSPNNPSCKAPHSCGAFQPDRNLRHSRCAGMVSLCLEEQHARSNRPEIPDAID